MNRKVWIAMVGVVVFAGAGLADLYGNGKEKRVRANLTGYQEVPAVSTTGNGEFSAKINSSDTELTYTLEYSDMIGTVSQAHIHFGQKSVNGGISIWLCSNLASPPTPAGTPACPGTSGTVTRTVGAADVVGPAPGGIAPGEFAEILQAIRSGVAYANVHSTMWGGGEIRGQIGGGQNDD